MSLICEYDGIPWYDNVEEFISKCPDNVTVHSRRKGKGELNYIDNLITTFDIETSSFRDDKWDKKACMYVGQYLIYDRENHVGCGLIFRTWDEFVLLNQMLVVKYGLEENRRLICWVQNLAYEFQWMRKWFAWISVFARETRSPMRALTTDGVEYRCSYCLSGTSLENMAKELVNHTVSKKVGYLDYSLVRTSTTPLTEKEIEYCVYDDIVVAYYIEEMLDRYKYQDMIPMTKTGIVREYCRNKCLNRKNYKAYRSVISELTCSGKEEYMMWKRTFQGGFTHASWRHSGTTFKVPVQSFDFTSSYPAVMVSEKYPMGKGELIEVNSIEELENLSNDYCLIFNIQFEDLIATYDNEHYLSVSKCYRAEEICADNGRVINAKKLVTSITNVDWDIIKKCYTWRECKIGKCWRYYKSYLPKTFVECVLDFYVDKTTLKDVEGQESEYQLKKGMLNSCYGMSVTDIVNDEIDYSEDWETVPANIEEAIQNYNDNTRRFLFYPWGIFVTAYARRNLWYGIRECEDDYIYSDTDSIKIINAEKHLEFIARYNHWITRRLERACVYNHIPVSRIRPKTVKGKEKPLGVWDDDGTYIAFKTLGAKRYLVQYSDGKIKPTIAGVNKKKGAEWFMSLENPFEEFSDYMCVPQEYSGRLVSTYLDKEIKGTVVDYMGNVGEYRELSGVNLTASEYNMTLTPLYRALIGGNVKEII